MARADGIPRGCSLATAGGDIGKCPLLDMANREILARLAVQATTHVLGLHRKRVGAWRQTVGGSADNTSADRDLLDRPTKLWSIQHSLCRRRLPESATDYVDLAAEADQIRSASGEQR